MHSVYRIKSAKFSDPNIVFPDSLHDKKKKFAKFSDPNIAFLDSLHNKKKNSTPKKVQRRMNTRKPRRMR